jgi:anthranilate synthase component I
LLRLYKLKQDICLPDLFAKIYSAYDKVFILESLSGPRELSEMTVIGFDPEISVTCNSSKFKVYNRKGKLLHDWKVTEPLTQLRKIVPRIDDNRFRFVGGAVGYISYDVIRFWEDLPNKHKRMKRHFPLLEFGIYTDGILYDHLNNQAYYFSTGRRSRLRVIQKVVATKSHYADNARNFFYSNPKTNMSKTQFVKAVEKLKRYIYDGDVYQVVLSRKMKFNVKGNLLHVYRMLREVNPSPYMYLLKIANRYIIGSSPEMLVRVTKGHVESFPIAGTRPIVNDETVNEKLRQELLQDEKEIAEHTMLVDLSRNDVGRVCRYGTVRVLDHMTVKRFSHVQHIVSHVTGQLQRDKDSYDAFKAVFPAGTVSGAPKVRAMEIIDEVEPEQREAYAGAVGYFSSNGCCDFAITIRSLFVNKNEAYLQSGAGIVMDSVPENEWMETEQKANAILSTLKRSLDQTRNVRKV